MELEAIGRVTVGDLSIQVRRQVDNMDGAKRTLLGTDTTTDTETLGDERDLGVRVDFDTQLASPDNRARLLAFLTAFLHR